MSGEATERRRYDSDVMELRVIVPRLEQRVDELAKQLEEKADNDDTRDRFMRCETLLAKKLYRAELDKELDKMTVARTEKLREMETIRETLRLETNARLERMDGRLTEVEHRIWMAIGVIGFIASLATLLVKWLH